MPDLPAISIVIRTFNSARTLGMVLSRLSLQSGDELIVVDSGSTDTTLAVAAQHSARIVPAPAPFHYSKSLNLGFAAARNPWVLVLSSHSIPLHDSFLDSHRHQVAEFSKETMVSYAPSTINGRSDSRLDQNAPTFFSKDEEAGVMSICGNANTIYRREGWEELPFDETVRTSEDRVWIRKMLERGSGCAYNPRPRCLNQNTASLAYMFRKGFRDSRAAPGSAHRAMNLRHLAGALKNLALPRLRGEIGWGNWARWSAHAFGQYCASYYNEDNTPVDGAS